MSAFFGPWNHRAPPLGLVPVACSKVSVRLAPSRLHPLNWYLCSVHGRDGRDGREA
jgi:hypothetical protein